MESSAVYILLYIDLCKLHFVSYSETLATSDGEDILQCGSTPKKTKV